MTKMTSDIFFENLEPTLLVKGRLEQCLASLRAGAGASTRRWLRRPDSARTRRRLGADSARLGEVRREPRGLRHGSLSFLSFRFDPQCSGHAAFVNSVNSVNSVKSACAFSWFAITGRRHDNSFSSVALLAVKTAVNTVDGIDTFDKN